jgi:FkbM family methyltransferase
MNDKILIISDKYNYQQLMNGKDDNLIQERIIHYCGIRPLEERANPEFTKAFKYYESELKNILNYNVIQYNINSNNYLFHYRKIDTENLNDMKYPFVKTTNNKKTIIDIGGNIGSSVIHFKKMYPDSTIYVFEPDPDCYEVLIKNTEQHDNIHCYNIGLFNENKIEKLNRNRFGSSGNSIYLKDGITSNSIDVTLRKTSEIFNELKLFNSNILKIDTEGCEIPILKDILLLNIDFELIYIEYHCDEDRFEIEKLLYPKYRLINVNIMYKNIGELTYVNDNIERVDYNGLLLPNQKS